MTQKQFDSLKIGDTVKVIDCKELREWDRWKGCVNKETKLSNTTFEDYREDEVLPCIILFHNKYSINFTKEMLKLVSKGKSKPIKKKSKKI